MPMGDSPKTGTGALKVAAPKLFHSKLRKQKHHKSLVFIA
jgi:hypothetical protein